MLNRRKFLAVGAAALASPALSIPAFSQTLCEVWDQTLLWDVRHALWGSSSSQRLERVVYVLATPWCPYAQKLVREYLDGPGDYEMRIVPFDVPQAVHRLQQADIVLNNLEGIKRTFVDRVGSPTLSSEMQKRIHDANLIAQEGFGLRFPTKFVSPAMIYQDADGANSFAGYKALSEFDTTLVPIDYEIHNLAADLEAIVSAERRMSPRAIQTHYATAIHALPDDRSASVGCSKANIVYPRAVGTITWLGTDWVKAHVLNTVDGEPVYGYLQARDISFA